MDKHKMDKPTIKLRAMKLEDTTKEDTKMDDTTKDDPHPGGPEETKEEDEEEDEDYDYDDDDDDDIYDDEIDDDEIDDDEIDDNEIDDEEDDDDENDDPLEIGGFLTLRRNHDHRSTTAPPSDPTLNPTRITPPPTTSTSTSTPTNPKPPFPRLPPPPSPSSTPTNVQARDLAAGHAILYQGRPVEIVSRTDSLLSKGPLASRHRVRLVLVELFDKEVVRVVGGDEGGGKGGEGALDVKATEWLMRVGSERVRYSLLSLDGPHQNIMTMQTQHRDVAKRKTVAFRIPARGKLGSQVANFLSMCEEREDRAGMPVTVLLLEAVGLFQLIGLGVGDWNALG